MTLAAVRSLAVCFARSSSERSQITVLVKGADDKIIARLRRDQNVQSTVSYVETFAKIGLRTLCIAYLIPCRARSLLTALA